MPFHTASLIQSTAMRASGQFLLFLVQITIPAETADQMCFFSLGIAVQGGQQYVEKDDRHHADGGDQKGHNERIVGQLNHCFSLHSSVMMPLPPLRDFFQGMARIQRSVCLMAGMSLSLWFRGVTISTFPSGLTMTIISRYLP